MERERLWSKFVETGNVEDYLEYKRRTKEQ